MHKNTIIDLIPLAVFFIFYYVTRNIFTATIACIVASWVSLIVLYMMRKTISNTTYLSITLITILGGLTILLHNKIFVMLKPTVLFELVGISLLVGQITKRNGIKFILHKEINLNNISWNALNICWALFFICMGILNYYIAFHYPLYVWVKFKVFGVLALTLAFSIITAIFVAIKSKR